MRVALPAALALLLVGGLAACGPTDAPDPTVGGQTTTATTNEETSMSDQQVREAAEAEQPAAEARLREVAALLRSLDELESERPRWLGGGTAACTWDRSSLSYIARGSIPVESPSTAADDLVAQLPDTWTPNERASTGNARYFEDPEGYLLMVSHQSDPDFALLSVESPCH